MKDYYDFDQSFASMVVVDIEDYFERDKLVKKILTIPKWVNDFGNKTNINFSKLLTESVSNLMIEK